VCVCVCVCFDKITNLIIVIGIGFKSSDGGVMNITACVVGEGTVHAIYIYRHIYVKALLYLFKYIHLNQLKQGNMQQQLLLIKRIHNM
jgi:hypothetical protein